jgi:Domain of unknown function (DUF4124)
MDWPRIVPLLLIALPAHAGPYKCVRPDGGIVYQQGPCAASDQGGEVAVDIRPPGGADAVPQDLDLSVEGQLKALESARAKERKARAAATKEADGAAPAPTYDRAQCAKHRAEASRWEDEVRATYRTQAEKARDRHMLEYHQALVERYCAPQ